MSKKKSYAGKWVAWTKDLKQIVASHKKIKKLQKLVADQEVVFERIPEHLELVEGQ